MRRWIGWAARCYPAAWRERYGDEFAALLEDAEPRLRDVWDVLRGALSMQVKTPAAYMKFGVVTALIGAIAAGAASLAMPKRYVSTAVLRPSQPLDAEAALRLRQKQQDLLSRGSLSEVILRPSIDLYREERRKYPMEDLLQDMRQRDLKISADPSGVRVAFEYDDPLKAQAVVRELSARLGDGVLEVVTPASLPGSPVRPAWVRVIATGLLAGLAVGLLLAFLRGRTVRWVLKAAAYTLAGGMAAIAVCLLLPETLLDQSRMYVFVGLGAAAGLTLGAFLLRPRTAGAGIAAQVAFCAACFGLLGAFGSYLVGERYVSTATLRMYSMAPATGETAERLRVLTENFLSRGSLADLIQRPALDLYRRERQRYPMEDIIQEMRTRDIRIEAATDAGLAMLGPGLAFRISYRYTDRFKAQAVVRELVTKYTEGNVLFERKVRPLGEAGGVLLEVIDPASMPSASISPNRPMVAGLGLAFGAMLGAVLGWRRWRAENPPSEGGPRPRYLRYALLAGFAGIVVAALASFAIPERYVSTAVLRVAVPEGQDALARAQEMIAQVMARDSLAEIIQLRELDLYRGERARRPMEEVLQRMRHDLQASTLTGSLGKESGPARTTAFRITFEYADRDKAQGCVRAVINKLVENRLVAAPRRDATHLFDNNLVESAAPQKLESPGSAVAPAAEVFLSGSPAAFMGGVGLPAPTQRGGDLFAPITADNEPRTDDISLEVLDAASRPELPVSPNRATISMAGGVAGLMVGLVLARSRRR